MNDARRVSKTDDGDTRIIPYANLKDHLAGTEGKKPVRFLILQMSADVENPTKLPLLQHRWERIFEKWWGRRRSVVDRFIEKSRPKPHFKFAVALCSSRVRTHMRAVRAYFLLDFAHSPAPIDTLRGEIQRGIGTWEWPDTVALGYGEHNVQEHVVMLLSKLDFMSDQSRPDFHLFGDEELKDAVREIRKQEQPAEGR
ncbi:hypothetical protein FOXG_21384 [Fusarium oxysporum f. sp. lycopersici 4287]|uniref:Uncharacterized protein n=1 Tax=Fusarium oxysporum f. sp. lycopersici (strain 4287 / CBS 123668 / FGSC 9935 / NRRL 34936) TaxID=426428 RepID=A0A0J9VX71_FUSO4|nr:hypothetical protein FOXG_20913 [Fusarium oxysporum f. sp. lycopersici 4287]XP_018253619.1 hypothetical protein FOXG_21384 [Fusarium oxysporum f. sp. lycopersici 4287]EWZ78182.1 hypothetical protein FOWG_17512 [Fusarium oxysporum f. sp. lycopersici MN25]KNB13767.1 hypothetical protein FOXG_20913 [Fusarium oxysporum f. sp. lycopersici 4287]KNB15574.1 hypothetical protein FOXG_21384 [Fusarium oxysporum f. sp. lycopersici 4287]